MIRRQYNDNQTITRFMNERILLPAPMEVPDGLSIIGNHFITLKPQPIPKTWWQRLTFRRQQYTDPTDALYGSPRGVATRLHLKWCRNYHFVNCEFYIINELPLEPKEWPAYNAFIEGCTFITLETEPS